MFWFYIYDFLAKLMRLFLIFLSDGLFFFGKPFNLVSWLFVPSPLTLAAPHQFDYIRLFVFLFLYSQPNLRILNFNMKLPVFTKSLTILKTETNTTFLEVKI